MTVKRKQPEAVEESSTQAQTKRAKKDSFFEELIEEDRAHPELLKPQRKKNKNKNRKLKNQLAAIQMPTEPEWVKGSGHHLQKYIKIKELVDIESLIQKYLSENKIDIIDGEIAEKRAAAYINEGALKVKSSELLRLERLKIIKEEKATKTRNTEQEELEEYFKDSLHIDMTKTFESMNLDKKLMRAITELDYKTPTPIQAACIPVALAGKDICGCAATGTGKTAAYLLPSMYRLLLSGKLSTPQTRVLVIVPTRELGVQVFQVGQSLAKFSKLTIGLVVGGMSTKTQETEIRKNPDIIIATPGRLLSHLKNLDVFTLEHIQVLILDEADRILDDYFEEQMSDIIGRCRTSRQTLLFSATMTTEVKRVATAALNEPIKVFVNSNTDVAQGLRQEYVIMKDGKTETRNATLIFLLIHVFNNNTIVFLPTKILCHRLYVILRMCGLQVGELHGKLPQSARLQNLAKFAKGDLRVLLATDLAARGLDIRGVDNVINYQLNQSYEMYVHRVGRTARAGREGLALSMVPDKEYKNLKMIKKMSKTVMYERRLDKGLVDAWKNKLEKLNDVCDQILEMEKETLKSRVEAGIKGQIKNLVVKNENKIKQEEKINVKTKEKSQLKEAAKAEGMTVKEFLQMKRLESNAVSNSQKKRVQRFLERRQNPLFGIAKPTAGDPREIQTISLRNERD
uniref:RNA helicase n=1 Tax=Hirondellea gigas TaxID=1518452 RepID=A0A6A7FVL9_9CRUS